jgi:hypothetical protein
VHLKPIKIPTTMARRLPPAVIEFLREQGAKGGRIGGKRALQTMTAEQRTARARKASKAAAEARMARGRKAKRTA